MPHSRASLFSLPAELIEEVIILSTLLGDTRTAATLAQTCRHLFSLVYHQLHKHLWREMFLVVFDHPCHAYKVCTLGRAPQCHLYPNEKGKGGKGDSHFPIDDYPWEDEFKRRIWTESFILRRTRPPSHETSIELPSTDCELYTVLQTLLRVISTAAPLPYDNLADIESHCGPYGPPHTHPIFSPLFVAAHTRPALIPESRNITWLARILAHGLPRTLMARLTVFDETGGVDVQKWPVKWGGLLTKLVAQIGLTTPITDTSCSIERRRASTVVLDVVDAKTSTGEEEMVVGDEGGTSEHRTTTTGDCRNWVSEDDDEDEDEDPDFEPDGESASESDEESECEIDGDEVLGSKATQETTALDGVRRLARIRVYNMAYLRPSRGFGPFLRVKPQPPSSPSTSKRNPYEEGEEEEEEDTYFDDDGENDDDDDDDDYNDETVDDEDGEEEEDGSSSQRDANNKSTTSSSPAFGFRKTHVSDNIPSGDQLRFDWAWIAAARQVIELNLRDLLKDRHHGVLRALLSLQGLRSCSAPGSPSEAESGESEGGECSQVFEDGEGWDWAGVEGQWRRCVCWLDYSDLIGNDAQPLDMRFSNPALYEVMRIIPLTLRITHYTRSPNTATLWPGRPTIHVAGEWHTASTPNELTCLRGTVEMTASGDIRWTLLSFREDGEGKWASEGVQVGGRGSATGVIGMWTGAEHEPDDPLGPFWAWKVGPAPSTSSTTG